MNVISNEPYGRDGCPGGYRSRMIAISLMNGRERAKEQN